MNSLKYNQHYLIEEHKISELVNELTILADMYKNCQCLRGKLSEAVTKALAIPSSPRDTKG